MSERENKGHVYKPIRYLTGRKPLTICISAICDNKSKKEKPKVVIAVDRMITSEGLSIEFEQRQAKIEVMTPYSTVISAGDALTPADILRRSKQELEGQTSLTIEEVADIIKKQFIKERKHQVEENLLIPRGFESVEDFYGKMSGLPTDIYTVIDSQIESFHITRGSQMEFLVSGVDVTGAHIYSVHDPGTKLCFDSIGYDATGSGESHAFSWFTSRDYTDRFPLNSAIWVAFEAKKRAEKAPGVGKETDMCVVEEDNITHLSDKTLSELGNLYMKKVEQDKRAFSSLPQINFRKA